MRKVKYLTFGIPLGFIAIGISLCFALQSCSIPMEITPRGTFVNIKNLYTPFIVYGLILFIGTSISIFTLIQVSKISKKLKELGYSI